jgi:hypothetical protein
VNTRRRPPDRVTSRELLERARHPTRRAAVLALVAGAIAVAVALDRGGGGAVAPGAAAPVLSGPTVPAPDSVSTAWYCTEGTGAPEQRGNETIWIANLGDDAARADVTVMPGGDTEPSSRRVTVPKHAQLSVPVSSVVSAAEQAEETGIIAGPGVVVEVFGGRAIVEHEIDGQTEGQADIAVGPCAREPGHEWYFAAGTTERGAEQRLSLFNPFADDAILDLSFATDAGLVAPTDLQSLVVPRRSRVTVPLANFVRRQAQVGAHVHVRTGRVVAEQSLEFTSENETRRGLTLSLGANAPALSWTLPGAVSENGASHAVYVANFDAAATEVEIAPRFEDQDTLAPSRVAIAGRSTALVDLGPLVGAGAAFDVQVRATRGVPVVAERLGAWGPPAGATGAATALGTPLPAHVWAFAVGRLASDDRAAVSVFNPGRDEAAVRLLVYEPGADRPAEVEEISVGAGKQGTFDLADLEIPTNRMIAVRANVPVVAARRILGSAGASVAPGVPDPQAG